MQRYKYSQLLVLARWLRLTFSLLLLALFILMAIHFKTCLYLLAQGRGQLKILLNTQSIASFSLQNKSKLTSNEKGNLLIIDRVKRFSVDSLGFNSTNNFNTFFNQGDSAVLWVITASNSYEINPYEWEFPLLGRLSYKGFFNRTMAKKEYNRIVSAGYDADIRSVQAWSSLGWFPDPLMSGTLKRSKGSFCNLLFHELFHATCFVPGNVTFSENAADFVAHLATISFLKEDEIGLTTYLKDHADHKTFSNYMLRRTAYLKNYYKTIKNSPDKHILKLKAIGEIADSIKFLNLHRNEKFMARKEEIKRFKNAYFVDYLQYSSLQDSLWLAFNKIYKGNLKNMVRDLKLNRFYY